MISTRNITKTTMLWCGVPLLAAGVILAIVAFNNQVRARNSHHNAEAMAKELRANGAIVENYYKVLGSSYHPASPYGSRFNWVAYIAAGGMIAAGGILIFKAPSFPKNKSSPNRN